MTTRNPAPYDQGQSTRKRRIKWFQQARFGMFVHWGLYARLGRHEWVMNRERIPVKEYEKLADTWQPVDRPARRWAKLARETGMTYMVMTTKHHDGFCLWDTQQTDYNAVQRGPKRDLVQEYVDACREFGLKVGLYYSLGDWHHRDCWPSLTSARARRRFIDFTHACVKELCSKYGKIDILWYDGAFRLRTADLWESAAMNSAVRDLQPEILINDRSLLPEDFGTPEGHVTPAGDGRAWEACMTMNGSWGYFPTAVDWVSVRDIIGMLRTASGGKGNLLLNIGPKPDGTVPDEVIERFKPLGQWIADNREAIYGDVDPVNTRLARENTGNWSLKGRTGYFWCSNWPGQTLTLAGLRTKVNNVSVMPTGEDLEFTQYKGRLIVTGLPKKCPDRLASVAVFKIDFAARPRQVINQDYNAYA